MRFWLLIGVAWTTLAVLSPAALRAGDLAFAKEGAEGEDKHGARKDDHGKGGHASAGTDKEGHEKSPWNVEEGLFKGAVDVALWTIVVFLVLFFVLRAYAWRPIAEGLDRREQSIARDKQEADAARAEASRLREQLQAELAKANDQVRQMMDKARKDAETLAADLVARGKADLQEERNRLHRELTVERDQALNQIWTQSVQLATLISTRAVKRQLSEDDHRKLLDESLADFRQALAGRREDIESAHA